MLYYLSIHAASILLQGLSQYAETTDRIFDEYMDYDYCLKRNQLIIVEATCLRNYLISSEDPIAKKLIEEVNFLIENRKLTNTHTSS